MLPGLSASFADSAAGATSGPVGSGNVFNAGSIFGNATGSGTGGSPGGGGGSGAGSGPVSQPQIGFSAGTNGGWPGWVYALGGLLAGVLLIKLVRP